MSRPSTRVLGLGGVVSARRIGSWGGGALAAALAWISGAVLEAAHAQVDANIQSTLQIYAHPLTLPSSDLQQLTDNTGACLSDPVFILILSRYKKLNFPALPVADNPGEIDIQKNSVVQFFDHNRQLAAKTLADFFRLHPNKKDIEKAVSEFYSKNKSSAKSPKQARIQAIAPSPIPYCAPQNITKFSFPFNPTDESNVLKSSLNNSPGTSLGFGGTVQYFATIPNTFNVLGFSASEQSVRYGQFPSKSLDSVTSQAAYQIYLGASGYKADGSLIDPIIPGTPTNPGTPKADIPPQGMITAYSIAFGFQNQTVYVPAFHSETVDLFTPQVTYNIQNLPLLNHKGCDAEIPDPRKQGFCSSVDFAFTAGQTFSDVSTQQNANFTVSMTPGQRIPDTDWKLTLPIAATGRFYEDVPGGRNDVLLQIGPALTYAPPPFFDATGGSYSALFSVSAIYNQNYSTVSTAAWHGYIIMPTLTIAFQPPPKLH
jgi:hypothetical protein